MNRTQEIDAIMETVPEYWRHRWCSGGPCACMGAANCSGRVGGKITHDEWKDWVRRNPEQKPIQSTCGWLNSGV